MRHFLQILILISVVLGGCNRNTVKVSIVINAKDNNGKELQSAEIFINKKSYGGSPEPQTSHRDVQQGLE